MGTGFDVLKNALIVNLGGPLVGSTVISYVKEEVRDDLDGIAPGTSVVATARMPLWDLTS